MTPVPVWRVGRKVCRTIYLQYGREPSDDDVLIGVMDSPELARMAVDAVNTELVRRAVEAANARLQGADDGPGD